MLLSKKSLQGDGSSLKTGDSMLHRFPRPPLKTEATEAGHQVVKILIINLNEKTCPHKKAEKYFSDFTACTILYFKISSPCALKGELNYIGLALVMKNVKYYHYGLLL